jgi:hypothetical protein
MVIMKINVFKVAALIAVAAPGQAWAICAANSSVSDYSITQNGSIWTYDFSVLNGCAPGHQQLLTDFYIPYFADADIANISVPALDNSTLPPTTWTYSIDPTDDLFELGPDAGVIDFEVTSLTQVSQTLSLLGVGYYGSENFSFTSSYAPVEGLYAILQTAYDGGLYNTTTLLFGDPSIPGSPDTIAALVAATAPEPGTWSLLVIGFCAMPFLGLRPLSPKAAEERGGFLRD